MFSTRKTLSALVLATALATGMAAPASAAAPGTVIAHTSELQPLTIWQDPVGCKQLPVGTHIIFNETDRAITIYADPLCLLPAEPFARVAAGYSTHVSAIGSFRA